MVCGDGYLDRVSVSVSGCDDGGVVKSDCFDTDV